MNPIRHVVDHFTGIQEVKSDFINEVHGLTDVGALSLQRVQGKSLCTTGSGPAVWGVFQGNFLINF